MPADGALNVAHQGQAGAVGAEAIVAGVPVHVRGAGEHGVGRGAEAVAVADSAGAVGASGVDAVVVGLVGAARGAAAPGALDVPAGAGEGDGVVAHHVVVRGGAPLAREHHAAVVAVDDVVLHESAVGVGVHVHA